MQKRKGYYNKKQAKINAVLKKFLITGCAAAPIYSNRSRQMSVKGILSIVHLGGRTEATKELMLEAISNKRYPYNAIKKRL